MPEPKTDALDVLAVHAASQPDKLAVVDDRPDGFVEAVTFREFNERVNRAAHGLAAAGFEAGERLIWAGRNSVDAMVVQQSVRKLGGFCIALNHRLQREEVHAIIRAAEPTIVWTEADFRSYFASETLSGVRAVVVFAGEPAVGQVSLGEFVGASTDEPPPDPTAGRFSSTLSFTSGTTGRPKGVMRHAMGSSELALLERIRGGQNDVFMLTGSLSHGGPGGYANVTLLAGGTVLLQRKFEAEDWLRLVERYRATLSYSSPLPIRHICDLPAETRSQYDSGSLCTMIAAAAQWSHPLKEAFVAAFPDCALWELYGSTELASVTVLEPEDALTRPGSCGKPVPGVDVILVDEEDRVVTEPHQQGLLYAKGDCVFLSYSGDADAERVARRGEHVTCGDIAYFDEDGFFYICDREKDMVNSGGINVYPIEIESVIDRHPAVFESAVFGVPDEAFGERVHAVIVLRDGSELGGDELIAHCRECLAGHKVPRSIEFRPELPHLLSGKIAKRELRAPYWESAGRRV